MKQSSLIDIVYLWVNGDDPVWRSKRDAAFNNQRALLQHAVYANVAGRFRDNDELRFNLRALEYFFPEHGHIYIVTDEQTPHWLQIQDGISMISHRDLIPPQSLPVFDSGHIESYLHHIDGLSERFIYLNDDVFFGARFNEELWFGQSGIAVFYETEKIPHYSEFQATETALVNASILSKHWLRQRYPEYQHANYIFAHAPRPMYKSLMHELERNAASEFAQVRTTVFRAWQSPPILPDLVPRWMLHTGLATLHEIEALYICSGAADAEAKFDLLVKNFGQLPFFCINDTSDDLAKHDAQLLKIGSVLDQLLPDASKFEKPMQAEHS